METAAGDPPDIEPQGKYNIHMDRVQGAVVGDYAHVEQHFHRVPTVKPFQAPPLPAYFVPRLEMEDGYAPD